MNKTIHYKHHLIILDGITAVIQYEGTSIYKTRFIDAVDAVKALKAFINLRIEQLERDKHINVYA